MSSFPDKNLLSTKEAARIFGYTPDYVARLAREKKIGRIRVGKSWLIKRDSLERFIALQGEHKKELARTFARARENEYKQANSVPVRLTRAVDRITPLALQSPESIAFVVRHLAAAVFSVLLVAGSAYASSAGITTQAFAKAHELIDSAAQGFAYLAQDVVVSARDHVRDANEYRLSYEPKTLIGVNEIVVSKSASRFASLPQSFAFLGAYESGLDSFTRTTSAPIAKKDAREVLGVVGGWVKNPGATSASLVARTGAAYRVVGETAYGLIGSVFEGYDALIARAGEAVVASALYVRDETPDASRAFVGGVGATLQAFAHVADATTDVYVAGVYGYTTHITTVPETLVTQALSLGDTAVHVVHAAPSTLVQASDAFATAWVEETHTTLAKALAFEAYTGQEVAEASAYAYRGATTGIQTATASVATALDTVSVALRTGAVALSSTLATTKDIIVHSGATLARIDTTGTVAAVEDATLGVLGKSALALSVFADRTNDFVASSYTSVMSSAANIVPAVPALPEFSAPERVALFTYKTLNGLFDRAGNAIAFLFNPQVDVVAVLPPEKSSTEEQPSSVVPTYPVSPVGVGGTVASSTTGSVVERIRETFAPQTIVQGLQRAEVENMLVALRTSLFGDILDTIYPIDYRGITIKSGFFKKGSISDATITDSEITNSTFEGPSVTTDLLTVTGDASVAGDLTVAGTININSVVSSGVVTAPYFTATSTTASTFPYASTTMLTATTASTTDLIVSSLTAGLVPFATTSGQFVDSPDFAFDQVAARLTVPNASTTNLTIASLTEGRVPLVGAGGAIIDTAGFAFDTTTNTLRATYASSTAGSVLDAFFVGRTATTTIRGDGFASILPYASSTALTVSGTGYFGTASTTNLTVSSLTSGRVPFVTTDGAITDSANLTFDSVATRLTVPYASSTALTVSQSTYLATTGGRVGIGTESPTESLQVNGVVRIQGAEDAGILAFGDAGSGAGYYNTGIWRGSLNNFIGGNYLNISSWGGIAFTTGNNSLGSQTTRMVIDEATGYVGIGTTSPTYALSVE